MPLRIAFDLDGVFADMEGELARQADILFGSRLASSGDQQSPNSRRQPELHGQPSRDPRPTPHHRSPTTHDDEPPLPALQLTARQQNRLWGHVEGIENFWETLREIEAGSVARLSRIAKERRWEVLFLTRRPATAGATAQRQSQRWLESKGFELPSVFVVQGSRGRIAASLALDLVVDDTPDNCFDVAVDSSARAILIWRDQQQPAPAGAKRLGIGVVKSVEHCLDILSQLDDENAKPGMMTRFMRLLGLDQKEPGNR